MRISITPNKMMNVSHSQLHFLDGPQFKEQAKHFFVSSQPTKN